MATRFSVIDFHSHILPALDHGCANVDTCIGQLELMKSCGTDIAVASSHFYPHIHKLARFEEKRRNAIDMLLSAPLRDTPKICVGAEVLLCEHLEKMEGLERLCIDGTNVLLLELPLHTLRRGHIDTVEELMNRNFTVLLAHIDRYLTNYSEGIEALISLGAKAQINTDLLSSPRTRKKLSPFLKNGDIHAIGSDLHGIDRKLYKSFTKSPKHLSPYYTKIMQNSALLLTDAKFIV